MKKFKNENPFAVPYEVGGEVIMVPPGGEVTRQDEVIPTFATPGVPEDELVTEGIPAAEISPPESDEPVEPPAEVEAAPEEAEAPAEEAEEEPVKKKRTTRRRSSQPKESEK